jgi:uncharacterized protein YjbI with pentapeptide repeats
MGKISDEDRQFIISDIAETLLPEVDPGGRLKTLLGQVGLEDVSIDAVVSGPVGFMVEKVIAGLESRSKVKPQGEVLDQEPLGLFLKQFAAKYYKGGLKENEYTNIIDRNNLILTPLKVEKEIKPQISEIVKSYQRYVANPQQPFDSRPLKDYYVEPKAAWVPASRWRASDEDVYSATPKEDMGCVSLIIEDYFLNEKDKRYLLIGGSFGAGRSTVARMLAARYADAYIDQTGIYLPILFMRGNLKEVSSDKLLKDLLIEISPAIKYEGKKILLILDALEESGNGVEPLVEELDQTISNFKEQLTIKTIITSNLGTETLEYFNKKSLFIKDEREREQKYVRLLPFSCERVNIFFKRYGTKIRYQDAIDLGWKEDEITKPAFAWMLALMYTSDQIKDQNMKDWSPEKRKAFLLFNIIHNHVLGWDAFQDEDKGYELFIKIKKAVRLVSALKQICENDRSSSDLTLSVLKEKLSNFKEVFGIEDDIGRLLKKYMFGTYLCESNARQGREGQVDFIFTIFREYLLAEYYIESILTEKFYRLNIGIPSKQTMEFLDGLVELLLETNTNNSKVLGPILVDDTSLLKTFRNDTKWEKVKDSLITTLLDCLKEDEKIFSNTIKERDTFWKQITIESEQLSMHKWISLFILSKLSSDEDEKKRIATVKTNLVDLLMSSNKRSIPYYIRKLNNVDLSNIDLSYAILSGFDLSASRLLGVNLFYANLGKSSLRKAELSLANLRRSYIYHADLSRACLHGATLYQADIRRSCAEKTDLSEADLRGADLYHTELKGAIFNGADLSGANFLHANLSEADLREADLREADLREADLREADLREADLREADLREADLREADLREADLSGANLLHANLRGAKVHGAILTNAKGANLSDVDKTNEGKEIKISSPIDPRTNLTGIWRANDAATYYVHHTQGNIVWWFGISNAGRWANVFKSDAVDLEKGVIRGEWADVPQRQSTELNSGILALRIKKDSDGKTILRVKDQTGGFGGGFWRSIDDLEIDYVDNVKKIRSYPNLQERYDGYTGIWRSKGGLFYYYLHETSNDVIWGLGLGVSNEKQFMKVFKGSLDRKGLTINGKYAELPYMKDKKFDQAKLEKAEIFFDIKEDTLIEKTSDQNKPTFVFRKYDISSDVP